jgi:hypothetical protein
MANIQTLQDAGLIAPDAQFSQADIALINSLSNEEVQALISVRVKLGKESDFLQRALVPDEGGGVPSIAIVF